MIEMYRYVNTKRASHAMVARVDSTGATRYEPLCGEPLPIVLRTTAPSKRLCKQCEKLIRQAAKGSAR